MDLVVAITGASGSIYGIRLLEVLRRKGIQVHLIISSWGQETIKIETEYTLEDIVNLSYQAYDSNNLAAKIASGSFQTQGMIIAPCSMKTLAAIASGFTSNLIHRAADITLKEQRRLILLPRETPLNAIHLENMYKLARMGVVIMPPVPAFYAQPKTIDNLVDHTIGRVLDQFSIEHNLLKRWDGL